LILPADTSGESIPIPDNCITRDTDILMRKLEAVLFDMDGVLLDSEAFICAAGIEMFSEKGYRVSREDFTEFTGMGENRYLGGVAGKHGIPFDLEKDKARTYEIYARLVKGKLTLLPGAREFVERCRKRGLKIALASSADRIKVDINLEETGLQHELFQAIVSGEDIEHKKPAPDIFVRAAQLLQINPSHCLVVEDAISGVASGKAAGCRVLALITSFGEAELSEADWITSDLSRTGDEVLDW
jgi:beta-phosphoglucomutase